MRLWGLFFTQLPVMQFIRDTLTCRSRIRWAATSCRKGFWTLAGDSEFRAPFHQCLVRHAVLWR